MKITVIEDDQVLSKVITEELKEAGFNVNQAFDGNEGLKSIQDDRPDLVLLDLLMPNKHGFEVLEELKKSPVTKDVPVIVMTMLGRDEDVKKGLSLGASDYIVKSQHAVGEIIDKVKGFFEGESKPGQGDTDSTVKSESQTSQNSETQTAPDNSEETQ